MADYGVLTTGFTAKPYDACLSEITAALREAFGESVAVGNDSILGRLAAIVANASAELWETAELVAASQTAEHAEGMALDSLCALAGVLRLGALPSTGSVVCTGDADVAVGVGALTLTTSSTNRSFTNTTANTTVAVAARAASTAVSLGTLRRNADAVFYASTAGTTSGSVGYGPLDTGSLPLDYETVEIADGTATWRFIGDGTAACEVLVESTASGAVIATAYDLRDITTPIGGIQDARNYADAVLGREIETDADLRARRLEILFNAITYPSGNAIRRALLDIPGVSEARVFTNTTDDVDDDGVPAHGIEAVVRGGDDAEVALTLFETVGAGIALGGELEFSITDAEGIAQSVRYSRPTDVPIWLEVDLTVDETTFEGDAGVAEITTNLLAYGQSLRTGRNVVAAQLVGVCMRTQGVLDVAMRFDASGTPTVDTTIVLDLRYLALFDSSRLTITYAAGEP